jgi:hypothetical protein
MGDRLAEGWIPEQISGWLKSGNEPQLRGIGCGTIYAFIYRTAQKAEAPGLCSSCVSVSHADRAETPWFGPEVARGANCEGIWACEWRSCLPDAI